MPGPLSGRLQQPKRIPNSTITTTNILPLQSCRVDNRHLAEPVFLRVQHGGHVRQRLSLAELAVALDIARHAVDDVGHGLAGVGAVGVVVHNGGVVDGAVLAEGVQALVPVNVAGAL